MSVILCALCVKVVIVEEKTKSSNSKDTKQMEVDSFECNYINGRIGLPFRLLSRKGRKDFYAKSAKGGSSHFFLFFPGEPPVFEGDGDIEGEFCPNDVIVT